MTKKRKPERVGGVVAEWLEDRGLTSRVEQASVIPDWAGLVGPQIAAVTSPTSVSADGTLWVQVNTNAWMSELSLMEPELLRVINRRIPRAPVRRIRWQIRTLP